MVCQYLINGNDAGFTNVSIKTNYKHVDDFINFFNMKDTEELFDEFYNLSIAFQHIDPNEKRKNQEDWDDFCTDILIFYVLRYLLYNIEIPLE